MAWKKFAIGAFCLWHMSAVAVHALYNVEAYPPLQWMYEQKGVFRPYILLTSQWQQWNLFSPDPLRRVTEMKVEARHAGGWVTVRTLDFSHLHFFNRSPELKIVRRLDDDTAGPLQERYVQDLCRTRHLIPETPMRLMMRSMVIPRYPYPVRPSSWSEWNPEWSAWTTHLTSCDSPLAAQ